jgi:hypothetical protein
MSRKVKTFDCVTMKNRIQAERLAEYEARRGEFTSYFDFINARVKNSGMAGGTCGGPAERPQREPDKEP